MWEGTDKTLDNSHKTYVYYSGNIFNDGVISTVVLQKNFDEYERCLKYIVINEVCK